VLLIEDEEAVRMVARRLLEGQGYTVLETCRAEDAEYLCRKYDGPIHLLITDLYLPRLNGDALASRLAPWRPQMRVLLISGHSQPWPFEEAGPARRHAFLAKPFTLDALARTVREVLDAPAA
jgi:DNA-binding NtrC family response regulator